MNVDGNAGGSPMNEQEIGERASLTTIDRAHKAGEIALCGALQKGSWQAVGERIPGVVFLQLADQGDDVVAEFLVCDGQ